MPKQTTLIKLFVSSPSDVDQERREIDIIINELNHTICKSLDAQIQVLKWETDVIPGIGRPQDLINKQINEYDIFLGIMWKRFGTPTGKAESGTEEEFNHAYSIWQQYSNLHILFYFSQAPFRLESKQDIRQYEKVHEFRKRLQDVGLVAEFDNPQTFSNTVRPHLTNLVTDIIRNYRKGAVPAMSTKEKVVERGPALPSDPIKTLAADQYDQMRLPHTEDAYSSFVPARDEASFLRLRVTTTPGFVQDSWRESSIYLLRDPIRPYLIQIGETRSHRKLGNPEVIPELTHLDYASLEQMYPFISRDHFKWIRMVIAELSTNPDVLDHIYRKDPDPEVRKTAAKNPSGSEALMSKECPFCNANFNYARRLADEFSESELTRIIRNDFPFGPNFHYMAIPKDPIHSWAEFTEPLLTDLNMLLWKFLNNKVEERTISGKTVRHIGRAPGVHIGFNSSIRHLVLTRHTRASAGASISHVHKQIWGMAEGTVNLSDYLTKICDSLQKQGIDYLGEYLSSLRRQGFVIWEDEHVALYVPVGQMSVHELQIMVKRPGANSYPVLTQAEVASLSRAEYLVVKIFDKLKIFSFNELLLTETLNQQSPTFRLILAFVTREVDFAVSELNHLYVVDKHPQDTIQAILTAFPAIERESGNAIKRQETFGCNVIETSSIKHWE